MPIEVDLPDGSVAEFPDGTSRDVMKAAISKKFPVKSTAQQVGEVATDVAQQLPQGFNRGLDSIINAPYNLIRTGVNAVGGNMPEAQPIFERFNSGVEPKGVSGRIAGSVGEAVGSSALPSAGIYGLASRTAGPLAANAGTLKTLGYNLLQGVRAAPVAAGAMDLASAAGSGTGKQLAEEAGGGPTAQFFGSLAGGLAPATFPIAKSLMQLGPQQQIKQNALLDAGQRQNIGIPRAVASGDSVAAVSGGMSQIPVIGSPIGAGFSRGVEETGARASSIASNLGSGSKYEAGRVAGQAIRDWLKTGSDDINRTFYDAVDSHIPNPQATGGPLTNTQKVVQDIMAEQAASTGRAATGTLGLVEEAVNRQGGLTYEGLKSLRTEIGARISGQITPEPGTSQPALKRLYGALTEDLKQTVKNVGSPKALGAFERANRVAKMVANRRDELSRVIGLQGDANPEKVFDTIVNLARQKGSGNLNRLTAARRAIGPEAWEEVQSAVVAQLGRDKDGNFSVARAVSGFGDMSSGGKNALLGARGAALRDDIEDLVTISRQFDRLSKNFATGSAKTNAMLNMIDKILAGVGGAAGALIYANPAAAIPVAATAGGAVAGRQVGKFLGNPTTRKALVQFSKAYVNQIRARSTATRTGLNEAVRGLASVLAAEEGTDQAAVEAAINKALAGN